MTSAGRESRASVGEEIFIKGAVHLPQGELVSAAETAGTDVPSTQVHALQITPHQEPVPQSEPASSPGLHQGMRCALSFNEGTFPFGHFGPYASIPANSHSRGSHGWEDSRGPSSEG